MKKTAVCAAALFASVAAWGANYYVDANNGNNDWDGTTASIPSQAVIDQCAAQGVPVPGPRKTLHAMMSDERVQPGDVVNAAEGDYNEGGVPTSATGITTNRVQVKAGVTLLATGSRDATFITGSGGSGDAAYNTGAVRCVYFIAPPDKAAYGYGIVKRFTLRNGRTASTDEQGGASSGNGLLVECALSGNGCRDGSRGGGMNGGTALRCKIGAASKGYALYYRTKAIDSLFSSSGGSYNLCTAYNCTFTGDSYLRNSSSYNCLYIGTGAGSASQAISGSSSPAKHYNTFSRSAFHATACITNETCRGVTAEETPYDATTFRPLVGSVAIDAGDMSYYVDATNGWKAAWLAECGKDYYGNDRVVNGAIDVGCGEAQEESSLTISDDSDGLVVTGAAIGTTDIPKGSSVDVTFSRNFTSDKLCTGVEVNGVFHSFGGTTSDVPYAVTFSATVGGVYNIAAVYETDQKDWYVSPSGNDANKGYHKNCPRKTLVKAMKLATANAGNVVHAAAGTYNEGEAWAGNSSNRVVVAEGVGLVADDWPSQETVIQGASATAEGKADTNGNGTNAVRCAYVLSGGYVKGFKLTGGRTQRGSSSGVARCGGGAVISGGALIDCELTGNGSGYRARAVYSVNGGAFIRCYFHDQVSAASYDICNGVVVDSYAKGSCYDCGLVLNCTFTDVVRANGKQQALNSYLASVSGANDGGMVCTNCVFTGKADDVINAGSTYDKATCKFSVPRADNLDENFRPKTAASPLVDAGSKELYDAKFPSKWVQFKGTDRANGQRVYNAQIDVGCGEYDCRADFAPLVGKFVDIPAMGPDVTTNAARKVVVPADESITLHSPSAGEGAKTRFRLVYTPESGAQTVVIAASTEDFVYDLEGPCTVEALFRQTGLVVVVR